MASVERYNPNTNTWVTVANMATGRVGHKAAMLNGKLYAVGGHRGGGDLKSCECYDPVADTWEQLPDMPSAREDLGVAVLDGKLWAAGGFTSERLTTVEVLDPVTNTWDASRANLINPRDEFNLVVLNGELHAVGGRSIEYNSVEKYNLQTNTWCVVPEMELPSTRGSACACVY